jgi:N-acetylglucosaminyl-diphospho-decaprenol L-rhamnosyltransferase
MSSIHLMPSGGLREVALVSVTYRSSAMLEFFCETVGQFPNVVVVDNHSQDGTPEHLRRLLPQATVVSLDSNIGFGPANNVGLKKVGAEILYVLFLNPDCRIEQSDVLRLIQALKQHPEAAVVSPVMHDGDGAVIRPRLRDYKQGYRHSSAREFDGDIDRPQVISGVCIDGACFLVDAARFRAVGGFDDRIFMYFEEDDIALRMAKHGFAVLLDTSSNATHLRGTSTRNTMRVLIRRAYHFRWSKYYLTNGHVGALSRLGEVARYLILSPLRLAWYALTMDKLRLARSVGWFLASVDGIFLTRLFRFL